MKINSIGANPNSSTTQEQQFKGNFSDQIITRISSAKKDRFVGTLATQIRKPPEELSKYFTRNPKKRTFSLYLTKKMSCEAFLQCKSITQETINKFDEIFSAVKKPTDAHLSIAHRSEYSFDDSYKIFTTVQNDHDKKSLLNKLIFLKDYRNHRIVLNPDTILSLLTSDSVKELNKDFNKYSSYIALNCNNTDVPQTVLNGIKNASFDTKKYDTLTKLKELRENNNILQVIPEEEMLNNYNPEAESLFELPSYKFHLIKKGEGSEELDFLLNIYKTTNSTNIKNRKLFFRNTQGALNPENTKENILSLFNKIENDSNFKKLYEKIHSNGSKALKNISAPRLSFLADKFGAKILIKRFNNLNTIIENNQFCDMDELTNILSNNLNNKFYHPEAEKRIFKEKEYMFLEQTNLRFMRKALNLIYKLKFETIPSLLGSKKCVETLNNTKFNDYKI